MRIIAIEFKNFWITGDSRNRQRVLKFALCLMAAYGFVFSSLGGQTRAETAHQALLIGAAVMALAPFIGRQAIKISPPDAPGVKRPVAVITSAVLGILSLGYASFSIQDRLATRSLKSLLEGKTSESELSKTVNILTLAAQSGVVVSPPLLNAAYRRVAGTQEHPADSKAWEAARGFVEYRSHLNVSNFSIAQQERYEPSKSSDPVLYEYAHPTGLTPPRQFAAPGVVPIADGAKVERIGEPLNLGNRTGNKSILFLGGAIQIDGLLIRHVVFRNVEIHYDGAPVMLDDVMFVNCRFVFLNNRPNTRVLGEQILTSTKVTANLDAT